MRRRWLFGLVTLAGVSLGAPRMAAAITISCNVNIDGVGVSAGGQGYADVSYSVSLSNGNANGGYGITTSTAPGPGTPSGPCGGSFVGSKSGTCHWTFDGGGPVRFRLTANGGDATGSASCNVQSGTSTIPGATPTPTASTPTPTPTPTALPTPSPTATPVGTGVPTASPVPHNCSLAVQSGVNGDGTPYVEISYSVNLNGSQQFGSYGLSQTTGPQGAPITGACTPGGPIVGGSTSGTCRWGNFAPPAVGWAEFKLTSSGGGTSPSQCTRLAETYIGGPAPSPTPTVRPTATATATPTAPPTAHECDVHVTPGTNADGTPYAAISYSVSLGGSQLGSYGISQITGPLGAPITGACTPGGPINGSTSGTCTWGHFAAPASGWVEFRLTSSGSGPNGPTVCSKTDGAFIGGAGCLSTCVQPGAICSTPCDVVPPNGTTPQPTNCEGFGRLFPAQANQCSVCIPESACEAAPDTANIFCEFSGGLSSIACDPLGRRATISCGSGSSCSLLCNGTTHQLSSECQFRCGDDICSDGFENHDNCPEDCPDPNPPSRIEIMTYNVQFLNGLATCPCDSLFPCPPPIIKACGVERAPLIARSPLVAGHDIVAFEELFHDRSRAVLSQRLRDQYPIQTQVIDGNPPGWIHHSNGGVSIYTRWPIVAQDQHIFHACHELVDCYAAKGVKYARIRPNDGRTYHVYATHTDADVFGPSPYNVQARRAQLEEMSDFISRTIGNTNPERDVLVLAGDFNIDKNNAEPPSEYGGMLLILNATPPTTIGGRTNLTGNWIDYVLNNRGPVWSLTPEPHWAHLLGPSHAQNESFNYAWDTAVPTNYPSYPYLSDHLPVLGSFVFENSLGVAEAPGDDPPPDAVPPAAPRLLAPSGEVGNDLQRFQWTSVPGAKYYRLSVSDGSTSELFVSATVPETSYRLEDQPMLEGQTYTWRVVALNDAGESAASPAATVVYRGQPLSAPQPLSPVGLVREAYPLLQWTAVEGADAYRVQVFQGSSVVFDGRFLGTALILPRPLKVKLDYRWVVTARRGSKWSTTSDGLAFRTAGSLVAVPAPSPLEPRGPEATCSPTFSWTPVEGADSYELSIVDTESESTIARLGGIVSLTAPPKPLVPGRRYRWSLRSQKDGVAGPESFSLAFSCDGASVGDAAP